MNTVTTFIVAPKHHLSAFAAMSQLLAGSIYWSISKQFVIIYMPNHMNIQSRIKNTGIRKCLYMANIIQKRE